MTTINHFISDGRFVRLYHIQEGDVFSFGVLLLELLTGRKVFDRRWTRAGESLVKWARPNLGKDKVEKIVDARLKGDYPPRAVAEVKSVVLVVKLFVDLVLFFHLIHDHDDLFKTGG